MEKTNKQRDSVVFYRSFYESIKELEPTGQAEVYNAIFEFALNGTEPQINGMAKAIFTLIKPQIVANNARYFNGLKGGRPQKNETDDEENGGENEDESDRKPEPNPNQNETEMEPRQNLDKTKVKPSSNLDLTKQKPKRNRRQTKAKPNENDNVNDNDIRTEVENISCDLSREGARVHRHVF